METESQEGVIENENMQTDARNTDQLECNQTDLQFESKPSVDVSETQVELKSVDTQIEEKMKSIVTEIETLEKQIEEPKSGLISETQTEINESNSQINEDKSQAVEDVNMDEKTTLEIKITNNENEQVSSEAEEISKPKEALHIEESNTLINETKEVDFVPENDQKLPATSQFDAPASQPNIPVDESTEANIENAIIMDEETELKIIEQIADFVDASSVTTKNDKLIESTSNMITQPENTKSESSIIITTTNTKENKLKDDQIPNENMFSLLKQFADSTNQKQTMESGDGSNNSGSSIKAKRNVAVKNSQASISKLLQPVQNRRNTNEHVIIDDDNDDLPYDIDKSDEYVPPKSLFSNAFNSANGADSDDSDSVLRKSGRLSKKPKILDEYIIDSIEPIVKPKYPKVAEQPFARKSTSFSPQNMIIASQQPAKIQSQYKSALPTSQISPTAQSSINKNLKLTSAIQQTSTQTTSTPVLSHIQSVLTGNAILSSSLATTSTTSTVATTNTDTVSSTQGVKQYRHKIVSCKPFYQTKATECHPVVKHVGTQIDLDEIKPTHTIVPVPVPINVPLPMCMYQAPMPVPIAIPIPIPVPIFIPTTKRTFDRVERRIRKLRKKLPSDPSEFQLLLYAEKLAREEGIPGFEESSEGESDTEIVGRKSKSDVTNKKKDEISTNPALMLSDHDSQFKWMYGVRIFNTWLTNKNQEISNKIPTDLLKLRNDELSIFLSEFIHVIRKPNGDNYAPESVYYLCLGIQYYLQESGRVENIFLDSYFEKFQESFNEIAIKYTVRLGPDNQIVSRIEEEVLWESKQLGAHSPFILLNTILYFNTKYFFLDKAESHLQLSFTNVKKHSKRNIGPNGEEYGKTIYLRYYPDFHGIEQVIYEQGENYDNPLRCPVKLYEFYLSKCPENVKNRSDLFYLLPERACTPNSPVWFSSQPLGVKTLERMLNRIKMVKEVNELLMAAQPTTHSTA